MQKIVLSFFISFTIILSSFAQDTIKAAKIYPGYEEKGIGGHFGVMQYILKSHSGENEIIVEDFYEIGFPAGVTIHKNDLSFDIEMVPFVDRESNVSFLFHPGVLFDLGNNFIFGTRAAFEIGQKQYGFTPLISKSFTCSNGQTTFIEIVFPVRFSANGPMTNIAGIHLGVKF